MIQLFLSLLTFLFLLPLQNTTHKLQIGLIVDENVPEDIVKFAKKGISGYYFSKISIIEGFEFPEEYRADTINVNKLINRYENKMPGNCDKYIFLTNKGIALNDNVNYSVRGLAKRQGKLCAVSTLVISEEATSKVQFEDLLAKVLIHELGHLFDLGHCIDNDKCVMVSSLPKPDSFYNAKNALCNYCLEKIDRKFVRKNEHNKTL